MSRFIPWLLMLVVGVAHSSDGEIGWTSLSFCNGAGYCVDITSSTGVGIDSLQIKRNGKVIYLPRDVAKDVQLPVLNEVRLINVWRHDGTGENRLEVPFLTPQSNGGSNRSILYLVLIDDKLSKVAIQEAKERSESP